MSVGQATNYLTFLITGDDSQLEATIERSKRTVAGLFDQQRSSAKALVDSAVYVNGWREALNGASETEKRVSATAVFEGQHRAAKRLVQDADYVAFWTKELDKADAAQRKLASQDAFIGSLKAQSDAIGKTRADLLEMQAAHMGISSQAAPFIAKLREAEKGIGGVGVSAAQTAAAMRMVPAQFTDIVVSLQAGQSPMTVLLQQGGQLKDMFGGIGAAAKGMASYVLGLVGPYTVLAAALAVLGGAYYQGSKEQNAYVSAITLTGNAAGVTSGQLQEYARQIGSVVGTQAQAADGLAAFVRAGVEGGSELRRYTQTAIEWEKATGQAVDETAKKFASLQDDPLKATLKLNEGTNFLTLTVYEQVKALDEQGRKTEAAQVAMEALDASMRERSNSIQGSLGYIERAWRAIAGAAKGAWDAMLNVGRPATINDKLAEVDKQLNDALANQSWGETEGGAATGRATSAYKKQVQDRIDALTAQKWALTEQANAEEMASVAQAESARVTKAKIAWDEAGIPLLSKSAKMERELTRERTLAAEAGISGLELEERLAAVRKKYAETGKSGGIKVTDNDLAGMRSQLEAAQQYHQQLLVMGPAAADLNQAERESLKISEQLKFVTDAKTVARLKEKQAVADALAVQLRSNEGLEKSYKAHQDSIDSNYKEAESIYERAREQEAANKVFGKGRTAVQEMVLATLQQQLVEAESRDNFDPKYVASLRTKIAAQKEWVTTLGQADYKQVMQRAEELLRNANELARAYEDELALAGKTGLEREKILARRAVELKYAKELDAINKSSLLDEEKRAAAEVVNNAKRIEMVAAAGKATQDYMAKASDEINRSLTDALMRGFESGKSFAQNLADTVKNLFGTMVLRPIISAVMMPVSMDINRAVQGGLNAVGLGSGAGGGGGGLLSGSMTDWSTMGNKGAAWLWEQGNSLMDAGWGKLGESVMGLGSTVNSVNAYLKGIPGMSGGIGSAAGYLGSIYSLSQGKYGSAVGSAIGTYILPGIGTMIGGVLGGLVDGLFGSGGTQEYGGTAMYSAARGVQTSTTHGAFGTGFGGVAANEQILANVSGISKSIVDALDATAKSFGKTVGYEAAAGFASDFGDDATWGGLRIALGDKDLVNWDDTRTSKWAPKEFASGDEGYKQYLNAVALDVKTALLGMDLPGWANQLVSAATDLDTINAALQQVAAVRAMFDSLGRSMQMFAGISGDLQTQLIQASGSVDALSSNVGAFYQGFYTEQERMGGAQRQLRESLSGLGIGIDPALGDYAKEQFRATVEAAMAGGQGELAAQLLALSGSFATVADYAQKAADDSVARLNEIMGQQHLLYADLAEAEGDYAAAAQRRYWVETAGMSRAEQAAYDYISAIRQQVSAAQQLKQLSDTRWSLENDLLNAQGNTSEVARRQRERDLAEMTKGLDAEQAAKVTAAYDYNVALRAQIETQRLASEAAQQAAQAQQAAAEQIRSSWQSIGDSVVNEINRIRGLVVSDSSMGLDYYQAQFAIATGQARAGDQTAASKLAEISQAMLGVAQSGALSMFELQRLRATTASSLEDTLDELQRKFGISVAVPQFAGGGLHDGGLRIVGERSWELEATGPSRIWNQQQIGQALSGGGGGNAELIAAIEQLAVRLEAIEGNTGGLLDITDNKSEGGNADRVEIMNIEELAKAIVREMA